MDVLKDGSVRVPVPAGLLVWARGDKDSRFPLSGRHSRRPPLCSVLSTRPGSPRAGCGLAGRIHERRAARRRAGWRVGINRASLTATEDMEVTVAGGVVTRSFGRRSDRDGFGEEGFAFTCREAVEQPRAVSRCVCAVRSRSSSASARIPPASTPKWSSRSCRARPNRRVFAVPKGVAIGSRARRIGGGVGSKERRAGGELPRAGRGRVRFGSLGEARLPRKKPSMCRCSACSSRAGNRRGGGRSDRRGRDQKPALGPGPRRGPELGPMLSARQSPALSASRVRPDAAARALRLDVARTAQQAILTANVEEARHRVLLSRDGKALVQARFAVRNNQRNFARILLPPGATLWSASVAGRPVRPERRRMAACSCRCSKPGPATALPYSESRCSASRRERPGRSKGRAALPLAALDIQISRTTIPCIYPPLFRVTPDTGAPTCRRFSRRGSRF